MKLLFLIAGWSAVAWGSAFTFTTTVQSDACPPAIFCEKTVSAAGTFLISFSGLELVYPPGFPYQVFTLKIPVTESVSGQLGYAGSDVYVNGRGFGGDHPASNAFDLEYAHIDLSAMQPFLVTINVTEHARAETFDKRFMGGSYFPTQATASATVNFDQLRILDVRDNDVTGEVTFSVTQESAIPEPATPLLVLAGALVFRRWARRFRRP